MPEPQRPSVKPRPSRAGQIEGSRRRDSQARHDNLRQGQGQLALVRIRDGFTVVGLIASRLRAYTEAATSSVLGKVTSPITDRTGIDTT